MSSNRALIVVDMQRGFLEEGYPLYCGAEARRIIPALHRRVKEALDQGIPVFFTADAHDQNDREFKIFPPHCIRGTVEAEIIPELQPYLKRGILIEKRRYSAFFDTDLHRRLQELGVEELTFCGVCTDICVLYTVADARNRDYTVVVPADCVASFDPEGHAFALNHMARVLGARVVGGKEE